MILFPEWENLNDFRPGGSSVIRSVDGGDVIEDDEFGSWFGSPPLPPQDSNGLSVGEDRATSTRSDGKGPSHQLVEPSLWSWIENKSLLFNSY